MKLVKIFNFFIIEMINAVSYQLIINYFSNISYKI